EGTVHAMIDCITSLYDAGIEARHSERDRVATPHAVPALQVELAFTALDPRECAPQERVKRHTAVWARALAERGEAPPLWSIAWSERPGRHLRRRAADPDLDLLVLHRSQVDALSHYEVLDSVLASAVEVASCPVLAHPTRVRT